MVNIKKKKKNAALLGDIITNNGAEKIVEDLTPVIVTESKLFNPENTIDFGTCQDKSLNEFLNLKGTELVKLEINSVLEKGKILTEVFDKLSGNNQYDGLYYNWLTKMEYNPRTALRQRIRYELFCYGHDDRSKEYFASLPVKVIDKVYKHEEKNLIIAMVNNGEFKTHSDIINYIDEAIEAPGQKIKPVTTFYKSVFSFEKKLEKMDISESHKALEELRDVEKEVKRLKKIIKEKTEL